MWTIITVYNMMVFPGGAGSKEPACQFRAAGDEGLIPGSGRSLGGGHGKPLQYPCLGIPWTKEPGRLQSKESQRVGHA